VYKEGLGNAHLALCSTVLKIFFFIVERSSKYKNGLGNAHPAPKYFFIVKK
jgi:hypothetical protein